MKRMEIKVCCKDCGQEIEDAEIQVGKTWCKELQGIQIEVAPCRRCLELECERVRKEIIKEKENE